MTPVAPRATIHADLVLDVDDRAVRVTADGHDVVVRVEDVIGLIGALTAVPLPVGARRPNLRSVVRDVADTGARHGVTVSVEGPHGRLMTAGDGVGSTRTVRTLSGTAHLRFGSRAALGPVLRPGLLLAATRLRAAVSRRITRP